MLHTLKIFVRNLRKNKTISIITIGGYAISMSIIFVLVSFIFTERGVNRGFDNFENIYRIKRAQSEVYIPESLLYDIKDKISGIEKTSLYSMGENLYTFNEKKFPARFIATNDDFLDIFSFDFIYKAENASLSVNDNILLTKSFSEKVFGNENPVGEILEIDNKIFHIAGVVTDPPESSSFRFDAFTSIEMAFAKNVFGVDNETHNLLNGFVLLNPNANPEDINQQVSGMVSHWNAFKDEKLFLQPFKEVYFDSSYDDDMTHANTGMIYLLSCVAVLILFMTIFNYVNLTVSRGYERLNEIGIKKATGAGRSKIFNQFLLESMLVSFVAMASALVISTFISPLFSDILGKKIDILNLFLQPHTLLILTILFLFTGLISGLYPALAVSKITPVQIINRRATVRKANNRYGVVTLQFFITTFLLILLLSINKQIDFVKNKDLGFDQDLLIKLSLNGNALQKWEVLKNSLLTSPNIHNVSATYGSPFDIREISSGTFDDSGEKEVESMRAISIDEDFLSTFNLNLIRGRNIEPSDTNVCFINEHLYNFLEWDHFEGKKVFGCRVIGVIKDFNHLNLHNNIGPLQLKKLGGNPSALNIKIRGDIPQNLDFIKQTFADIEPGAPIHYQFYDDWVNAMYQKEESQAYAIKIFTFLAIIISCLGLVGLAEHLTRKKVKEIGIRKVNGARIWEILALLNKDFARWVLVAFVIACPIAWFAMQKWLENFAYKTELNWWIFALAGAIALGVALLTVSWQSWKAATRNPVEALRYE